MASVEKKCAHPVCQCMVQPHGPEHPYSSASSEKAPNSATLNGACSSGG